MKVVIAIDSLKGSLTSMEAGNAAREAVLSVHPDAEVIVRPLADGGEGTTDALIEGLHGERISLTVRGPLGDSVNCCYGLLRDTDTAVMEMAAAAGITLLPDGVKDPLHAGTYGVGEMIRHAIDGGCREFIVGIGGSATNDGGIGMLKALGFEFYDRDGRDAGEGGAALGKVASIGTANRLPALDACHFRVACDVTNPLCGENGATFVYGPQKGVTEDMKYRLDSDMQHYASVVRDTVGKDFSCTPGAGAAGGMGFAFLSFLNAELTPGIDLCLDAVGLENDIRDADIVITGEGQLDLQTAMGKVPVGVARLAKKYHAKVLAFAGSVTREASACNDEGIDAFFPILRRICTLEEAMNKENARQNMIDTVAQVFRLFS